MKQVNKQEEQEREHEGKILINAFDGDWNLTMVSLTFCIALMRMTASQQKDLQSNVDFFTEPKIKE